MNISFKSNCVTPFLFFFLLIMVGCAAQTPNKQERLTAADPKAEFERLCVLLTPKNDSASDDLIRQWRKEVENRTRFKVEDHITVIESLQKEQAELYKQYNNCDAQLKIDKQNYSSQWLIDLTNMFGLDYLKENKNDVFKCLGAMIYLPINHYCRPTQEKMVINEETLAIAYERYCDFFNRFYDDLSKNQKAILTDQHKQVSRLQDSIKHELNVVFTYQILMTKLTEQSAIRSNRELYLYMKNDLNMMKFDPLKAVDDFKRLIK